MPSYCKFLLSFFISIGVIGIISAQEDELSNEILKLIKFETNIDIKKHPGFIVGIVDGDTCFYRSFGRDANKLNEETIFEIGSVSKVFTSALVSILEEKELLSYNDKLDQYINDEYKNKNSQQITILDLLTHQSGFPKRPSFFGIKEKDIQNPYAAYTNADLMEFYKNYTNDDYSNFKYSHTNYAFLEWIIEKVTIAPYDISLDAHLTRALGLHNTYSSSKDSIAIIQGYNRSFNKVTPWTYQSFEASEGIKSTASDICKFLQYYFDENNSPLSNTLRKTLTIETTTNYDPNISMAHGWHIIGQKKYHDIIMHSGRTAGHHATVMMIPSTGTAVVVLSSSAEGTQNLPYEMLRMINYNWKRKSL